MGVPDLLHRHHARQLALVSDLLDGAAARPMEPRLQLLGGFALTVADVDRTPAPGHSATLVKVLALHGPRTVEAAIDLLWPELDPDTGRARLRNLLNRLKERSGPIVARRGTTLCLDPQVHVDADGFTSAAAAALAAPEHERVGRARHAVALYRGELLPGDPYDDWAAGPRARLQRRFVALADLIAEDCIARGELDEAASLLDLGVAAEPLDEARPLRLCRLLAGQGRTGEARQVAARTVAALADLDVEPDPELLRFAG
jgi:DNA-binding SARP family transcriptional activator